MNSAISRLNSLLTTSTKVVETALPTTLETPKVKTEAPAVLDKFEDFIKVVEKTFGKDSIISTDSNGAVLRVTMSKSVFDQNQDKFNLKEREDWIFGNGMALLSTLPEIEPPSMKLWFCRLQTLQSPE
jgi:hypothetical protein